MINKKEVDKIAKAIYNDYINNHPTIHTNRFPGWSELDEESKKPWLRRAKRDN